MPPAANQPWNRVKQFVGFVEGIFGGGGTHDSTDDPACENADFDPPENNTTRKRKVAAGTDASDKRRAGASAHEKRLLGDYDSPADAVQIGIPTQRSTGLDGGGDGGRAGSMATMLRPKVGGSRFKPTDTLSRTSLNTPPAARDARTRSEEEGMGKSSYAPVRARGEGFTQQERGAPVAKRPRIERKQKDLASDPITDDEKTASVTKVNGSVVQSSRMDTRKRQLASSESQAKPFEGQEHKAVDQYNVGQQKSRRRPADGNQSSQASSRASPQVIVNGHSGKTAEDAVLIDDTSQEISQSHIQRPPSSAGGDLPDPSTLMNGVEEAGQKRRRQSSTSVEFTHTQKVSSMRPSATKLKNAQRSPNQREEQRFRRTIEQGDATEKHMRQIAQRPLEESNTRSTFVRDDSTAQSAACFKPKRKTMMKVDSYQVPLRPDAVDDSLGSVDELTGPTNVGNGSPEKLQQRTSGSPRQTRSASSSPAGLSSDLKSSKFITSERPSKTWPNVNVDKDAGWLRAPLRSFHSTSYYLREGDLEISLKYDPADHQLSVQLDKVPLPIKKQKAFVTITSPEADKVFYNETSPLVYLKGSSGFVSNGSMCIRFVDVAGMKWFLSKLPHACKTAPTFYEKSHEELVKIYSKQSQLLVEAWRKREGVVARDQALRERIETKNVNKAQSSDPDEIQYGPHKPGSDNKLSRRRGMMGDAIEDSPEAAGRIRVPKVLEKSRYFEEPPRRSSRQTRTTQHRSPTPPTPEPEKWTQVHKPAQWPHSVVYPTEGARRVTVDFPDLERLDEGEFLNDNVISFALRQIEENMATEHKERVHFFNSFFYTALTTKNGKKAFNYDAVKRWTKSKDLLGCDYVVVPINIDLHWFVAIICNLPNLSRRPAASDDFDDADDGVKSEQLPIDDKQQLPSSDVAEPPDAEQSGGETSENTKNTKGLRNLSLTDNEGTSKTMRPDESDGEAPAATARAASKTKFSPTARKPAGRKKNVKRAPSYDPEKPAIITLDSFAAPHTAEIRNLKDYIASEAETKRGIEVDTGQLQGLTAKNKGIPTQENFCDCGVYLVGYVEQFAKNPREFVTKALTRTLGQDGEFADFDPSEKRAKIRDELLALQEVQEAEYKAKKAGKKAAIGTASKEASASAAPSPKAQSKPTSKVASPIRTTAVPNVQPPRATPASMKPVDQREVSAQTDASQDKDLEYAVPRALGQMERRPEAAEDQSSRQLQQEFAQEEAPDETAFQQSRDQARCVRTSPPNVLLEKLQADLERSSQQQEERTQHQARAKREHDGIAGDAAANWKEDTVASEYNADLDRDDYSDGHEEDEVLDLGDETPAEIPDSQDLSPRAVGATGGGAKWMGKRMTFDD